jgi:ParB-like chromosome segregation protein Spo0J
VDRNGDAGYRLVFGQRRLEAHRMLKVPTIRAQLCEELTEAQLRAIEFEENENRKELTEGERARTFQSSKRLVEKARQAEEVLAQNAPKPKEKSLKEAGLSNPLLREQSLERSAFPVARWSARSSMWSLLTVVPS